MRCQSIQALVVALFAAIAFNVGAQTSTPSTTPYGAQGTPSTTAPAATGTMGTTGTYTRMTSDQIREYVAARKSCNALPASQQPRCNNDLNQKFGSVDPKCQKLSDAALADCLRGADRGAQ